MYDTSKNTALQSPYFCNPILATTNGGIIILEMKYTPRETMLQLTLRVKVTCVSNERSIVAAFGDCPGDVL